MSKIHIIARAIIKSEGSILLANYKDFFFLPGGHVKHCEPVGKALERELDEELGIKAESHRFIGVLECVWDNKGSPFHEINFVFNVIVKGLKKDIDVISKESHINFQWFDINAVKDIKFMPHGMSKIVLDSHEECRALISSHM